MYDIFRWINGMRIIYYTIFSASTEKKGDSNKYFEFNKYFYVLLFYNRF